MTERTYSVAKDYEHTADIVGPDAADAFSGGMKPAAAKPSIAPLRPGSTDPVDRELKPAPKAGFGAIVAIKPYFGPKMNAAPATTTTTTTTTTTATTSVEAMLLMAKLQKSNAPKKAAAAKAKNKKKAEEDDVDDASDDLGDTDEDQPRNAEEVEAKKLIDEQEAADEADYNPHAEESEAAIEPEGNAEEEEEAEEIPSKANGIATPTVVAAAAAAAVEQQQRDNEEDDDDEDSDNNDPKGVEFTRVSKSRISKILAEQKVKGNAKSEHGLEHSLYNLQINGEAAIQRDRTDLNLTEDKTAAMTEKRSIVKRYEAEQRQLTQALQSYLRAHLCSMSKKTHPEWHEEDEFAQAYKFFEHYIGNGEDEEVTVVPADLQRRRADALEPFFKTLGGSRLAERDQLDIDDVCLWLEGRRLLTYLAKTGRWELTNECIVNGLLWAMNVEHMPPESEISHVCQFSGVRITKPEDAKAIFLEAPDSDKKLYFAGLCYWQHAILLETASFACNVLENIDEDFSHYLVRDLKQAIQVEEDGIFLAKPFRNIDMIEAAVTGYISSKIESLVVQFWFARSLLRQLREGPLKNLAVDPSLLPDECGGQEYGPEMQKKIAEKRRDEDRKKRQSEQKKQNREQKKLKPDTVAVDPVAALDGLN